MDARRRWSWVLVFLLLVGSFPLSAVGDVRAAGTHKVIVDNADGATRAELERTDGARLIEDYGSFALWEVPDGVTKALAGRASVAQRDELDDLYLRSGAITPTKATPTAPANLRQGKTSGKQLWLVQFVGPVKPEWLKDLTDLGIETVIYMPNNAYVVWLDGGQLAQLEALVGKNPAIQWTGAYEPAYRLEPSLQALSGGKLVAVTVQFYRTGNTAASLASLRSLGGGTLLRGPEDILGFTNVTLELPADQLAAVAGRADVFNVEPYTPPKKNDERQGQILAGNITNSGGNIVPTGTGYLGWLAAKGFPTDPAQYPIVDIVDDGIDDGSTNPLHPDYHQLGVGSNPSRLVFNAKCTADATAKGTAGHGNLNAGIVGAYDNLSGIVSQDGAGYRYGLGMSPYGRIAGTKIFNDAGSFDLSTCGGTDAGIVATAYTNGANFTSNSWGANTAGAYDSSAQAWDALTRDASAGTAGSQQMLHIFAAGNAGSGAQTVGSPGTGKNVLTVGATENVRDNGILDGCSEANANNADDMATFSSRGPAADGRVKPEISGPGTHITGPASQAAGYDGTGVCGGTTGDVKYYPPGQTLYTWSSGTSHSTPAVAGAASLLWNYYGRVIYPANTTTAGATPSPAMMKALLLNTPRYLNGSGTGGTLPSNSQGWGDVNLGALFDSSITRTIYDQSAANTFTTTGDTRSFSGTLPAGQAFRVTLVWSDAAGPTTGNAFVNNLDLTVTVGGNTYKGNVFSGALSTTGGTADTKNNVENVFLPAGLSGPFTVTVTATNIAGKADPNGPGTVNQDFALVISTGASIGAPSLAAQTPTFTDTAPGGNNNGAIDPGDNIALTIPVKNSGDAAAVGVSATLTTATPGLVTVSSGSSGYPDISVGATASNSTPFRVQISPQMTCGASANLTLTLTYNGGKVVTLPVTLFVGNVGTPVNYASTDVPKAIPDNNATGVTSNLAVATTGTVGKVVVHLSATHTYDSDLTFTLIAPDNSTVTLISHRGGAADNFTSTVLDDSAANPISGGSAPFTGTFRPESPLAALSGKPINGTWKLKAVDSVAQDTGSITAWSLDIGSLSCAVPAANKPRIDSISPNFGPPAGGTVVTLTGANFTGSTVTVDGAAVTPTSITATQIVLTMPAHAAGSVGVAVTTANGTGATRFDYGATNPLPGQDPQAPTGPVTAPGSAPGARPSSGSGNPNPLPNPR